MKKMSEIVLVICIMTGLILLIIPPVEAVWLDEPVVPATAVPDAPPNDQFSAFSGLTISEESDPGTNSAVPESSSGSVRQPADNTQDDLGPQEVTLIEIKKSQPYEAVITWQEPDLPQGYMIRIYRHTSAMSKPGIIDQAVQSGEIAPGVKTFTDQVRENGRYFYAVAVVDGQGIVNRLLTPDQSYSTTGIELQATPPPALVLPGPVTDLTAQANSQGLVILEWTQPAGDDLKYNIYRSVFPVLSSNDLAGKLVSTLNGPGTDQVFEEGFYYYAVTVVSPQGENKKVGLGTNSLSAPVEYKKQDDQISLFQSSEPEPESPESIPEEETGMKDQTAAETRSPEPESPESIPEDETGMKDQTAVETRSPEPEPAPAVEPALESEPVVVPQPAVEQPKIEYGHEEKFLMIRKDYYYQENYERAVWALEELVSDASCPAAVKSQAELFIGRCYYHQKKYREAIRIFVQLLGVFPEEADFWLVKAAGKL